MNTFKGTRGFVEAECVYANNSYRFLISKLLGPSLQQLRQSLGSFSLLTILMIAEQMICRLAKVHAMNIVHRDVKPENFLIGLDDDAVTLHLIDFGLSCTYNERKHKQEKCIGTLRYMSRHSHKGYQQQPRDDLESLGYVLIYLSLGYLPWQKKLLAPNVDSRSIEFKKTVLKCKENCNVGELCSTLPIEFAEFLTYVRHLKSTETPDYDYMRRLFRSAGERECGIKEYWQWNKYEWIEKESKVNPLEGMKELKEKKQLSRKQSNSFFVNRPTFAISDARVPLSIEKMYSPTDAPKNLLNDIISGHPIYCPCIMCKSHLIDGVDELQTMDMSISEDSKVHEYTNVVV